MKPWMTATLAILELYDSRTPDDRTVAFLSALVRNAPTEAGQRNICESILKCRDQATQGSPLSRLLYELSQHYLTGIILPVRAKGGKTPIVSDHPSREQSMDQETMLNELFLEEAKRESKKLKELALLRDNYRSVLSGVADDESVVAGKVDQSDEPTTFTQASHILPFSLRINQPEQAAGWAVLSGFSGMDLTMFLCGNDINRLGNVLTLSVTERTCFGELKGWLEPVQELEHTYDVHSIRRYAGFPTGNRVTLTTPDKRLEIPDPRLIAIHAACAKVVYESGMAEHINRILRDWEGLPVLAEDGSSDALVYALHCIAVR